jgi:hypothetical protein
MYCRGNKKAFDNVTVTYRFSNTITKTRKCNTVKDALLCKHTYLLWRCGPTRAMASSFLMFLDRTQRRTTFGRTPLDEWSDRRRDLYLRTHKIHKTQTSMPPPPDGIRTHNLSRRTAVNLHLRPRGHWDRHVTIYIYYVGPILCGHAHFVQYVVVVIIIIIVVVVVAAVVVIAH